ncbi:MAG: hypothetical protein OXU20_13250 [Myxococcales bacterium]|nr:hypothetical protein [Myxococcales bacterium]MDD9968436.1 hypothetical protein [Myxococcales bacterium]
MNSKKKTLALAAVLLVILLFREAMNKPAERYVDDGEGAVAEAALAFRPADRAGNPDVPPVVPTALGERIETIRERSEPARSAQGGQAGMGGGPPVPPDPRTSEAPDTDHGSIASQSDMPSEARSIYPWEPSQQFLQWRRDWADEAPDPTWVEQLRTEFPGRTGDPAATLHQIDCRETVCQLYLHTANARDAQEVIASMSEDPLEYAQIADHVQLENAPMGGTLYEVVVRRDRPTWMRPHVAGAARAHALAEHAREGIE